MQPTLEEKRAALDAPESSKWEFSVSAPHVCTAFWNNDSWIAYIGDCWFLKPEKEQQ